MTVHYYQIHLVDELPRIGTGLRLVLAEEGRKYVHLVTPQLVTGRLRLKEWQRIPKREIELSLATRKRLRQIMRHWRKYRDRTRLIKRAEQAVTAQ